jgi:protein-S-isoprenylcysteine O-methyltransferase Ste14
LLLVGVIVGALLAQRLIPWPWPGLDDMPARLVGWGFGALGLAVLIWSIRTLHRHKTTVMPHQSATALARDGPYRWRRNPIYLADVFLMFGLAELTKNFWFVVAGLLFAVLVTWLAIIPEEKHLEAQFGDAYRDYKDQTRRWI